MSKLKKLKMRIFALLMALATVLSIPTVPVHAATTNDGLGSVMSNTTVYQNSNLTNAIGTVYAYETFTVLDWSYNSNWDKICHIEYSTSNGPKIGYVLTNSEDTMYTCVARVNYNTTVYYGNNTSLYMSAGTVYTNERVVVLGESGGWSYIEYNTSSGRKRGYVVTSSLGGYSTPDYGWHGFYLNSGGYTKYISGSYTTYSGYNTTYTKVGSVSNENVQVHYTLQPGNEGVCALFVTYQVNGTSQRKSGWIVYKNTF